MNINQFKQLLGYLYREQYKGDTAIQANLLELGWAIDRLLKKGQLTPFDNYDEHKKIIFKEMEWSDKWG
ncbi:hypothetical protein [Staphylococcus nepalensis]|uniref:hypothetical protein n=1 Tax=Staphylococcus nepalensis TaxID=214473 RepID=UPI000E057CB4|nr:hypothetical protein [Staphylococcus nepalensis]SUM69859.1 hypothetical phage-related protein [Staphylococcus nepalensis]SUM96083.1 hypothetical phage-related protein [Staphylococcus nepalensis]